MRNLVERILRYVYWVICAKIKSSFVKVAGELVEKEMSKWAPHDLPTILPEEATPEGLIYLQLIFSCI